MKTLLVVGALALGLTPSNAQTQWRLRYPLPTSEPLLGATYGKGLFVVVGFHHLLTSTDGISWTPRLPQSSLFLTHVAFGNGKFVVLASKGEMTMVLTSTDGTNWSSGFPASSIGLGQLVFADDVFVSFGKTIDADGAEVRAIATSADGLTWIERWRARAGNWWGIQYGASESVPIAAVGNGTVVVSSNGS